MKHCTNIYFDHKWIFYRFNAASDGTTTTAMQHCQEHCYEIQMLLEIQSVFILGLKKQGIQLPQMTTQLIPKIEVTMPVKVLYIFQFSSFLALP